MSGRKIDFADRLETAAKAKQALLEKARAKDPANDPEFAARLAERAAIAAAREARETERRLAKQAGRLGATALARGRSSAGESGEDFLAHQASLKKQSI